MVHAATLDVGASLQGMLSVSPVDSLDGGTSDVGTPDEDTLNVEVLEGQKVVVTPVLEEETPVGETACTGSVEVVLVSVEETAAEKDPERFESDW